MRYYGFVTAIEQADYQERIEMELIAIEWIDDYLRNTDANKEILEIFANTAPGIFEERFEQIRRPDLDRLHKIHLDFLFNLLRYSPSVALMQVYIESDTRQRFGEGSWYRLNFEIAKTKLDPLQETDSNHNQAIFTEITNPDEEDVRLVKNLEWEQLSEDYQTVLHTLHYPMIIEEEGGSWGSERLGPKSPVHNLKRINKDLIVYGPFETLFDAFYFSKRQLKRHYYEEICFFKVFDKWWVNSYTVDTSFYAFEDFIKNGHLSEVQEFSELSDPGFPGFPYNPLEFSAGLSLPFIGALAVGQASCTVVYDVAENPIAYLDFGMPLPYYRSTIPSNSVLPSVLSDPLIIMSHWDYDHYAMSRKVIDSYQMRWSAPQQTIGSVAAKELYAKIIYDPSGGGRLHLWPSQGYRGGTLPLEWGFVSRCTGTTRNDNGLVTIACFEGLAKQNGPSLRGPHTVQNIQPANPQVPVSQHKGACSLPGIRKQSIIWDEKYRAVLYPGDASFSSIPNISSMNTLIGLVTSHHGGERQCTNIPAAPLSLNLCKRPVAYSYGTYPASMALSEHCYKDKSGQGLPRDAACRAYKAAGWDHRMNTAPEAHVTTQPDPVIQGRNPAVYQSIGNAAIGWDLQGSDVITKDVRHGISQPTNQPLERKDAFSSISIKFQF